MSGNGSVEDNGVGNSSEKTEEKVHETRTLTQESVNEQKKGFIAPHTSARGIDSADSGDGNNAACEQLPRTDNSTISGTAAGQLVIRQNQRELIH